MKYKKGDTVIVTSGKDKGKRGKIEKILPDASRVVVSGINMYKKHMKRRDEKRPGGIIDVVLPIDVSKIAIICTSCNKQTRVGYIVTKNEKVRVCNKCKKKL